METIRALTLVAACVTATACSSKGGSTAPPPDPVVSLALHGGDFSCAVLASGAVRCWGTNISGQLGNAVGFGSESAVPVSAGVSAPVKLAAGGVHTCAALASGSVSCWGYGGHGELGNGSFDNSMTPATVTGLAHPLDLSAGLYHACALVSGGTVKCWGDNESGQLGLDPNLVQTSAVPVTVGF